MREMTPDEIRDFLLEGTRTAKVATTMADGTPHVMPVWFTLRGEDIVFCTGVDSVKARALRRDPRVSLVVDEEVAPYAFVHIRGVAEVSEDQAAIREVSTEVGGRYMGANRAQEFGERNSGPGEVLVRVSPHRVIAARDLAG